MCSHELECDSDQVPEMITTKVGTIEPFADWKKASITVGTPSAKSAELCCKGSFLRWAGLPLFEPDPIHVKANCAHNVYLSLHKRYLKITQEAQRNKLDFKLLNRIINSLAEQIKMRVKPFDSQSFLKNKTGRLRRRYYSAYKDLIRDGVDLNKISDISAFVKLERYFEDGKAPRMIMGRNPAFTLLYSQIVEPIERAFFELPQVANGCDNFSCGEKFEKLVGDWFVENDMSKYEASQRLFTLSMEYAVYSLVYDDQELLDRIFLAKLHKRGHTTTGVNFKFDNCRGSGDADTSLGNGILNYISTMYFLCINTCSTECGLDECHQHGCKATKFVLKGDDSYMSYPKTKEYLNTYAYFGFEAKIMIRTEPEKVEFCSGHFVEYQPGKYVYVQKLKKLLQSIQTCINADAIRNGWVGHYFKSLGLMYNTLYSGIPVYEDIGPFLMSVNVKFGLRKELIQSYNLLDMFNNRDKIGQLDVNRVCAAVSVSLVNDMCFGELKHVSTFLKTHTINIPPEQQKRCNVNTRTHEIGEVDFDSLNIQVKQARVAGDDGETLQKLRHFLKCVVSQ
jgi:hypothetical protein